ncbi:MAG: DUF3429 domain-containing protein [Pseudomonadota bacterium]
MTGLLDRVMPGVPKAAALLGLSGLIPFGAGGLIHLIYVETEVIRSLTLGYGVAILSFMGGCRWGLAAAGMGQGPSFLPLVFSVIPCLYAWAVSELPGYWAYFALAFGFAVLLAADLRLTADRGAPDWWPALRWPLSVGAVISLLIAGVF